MQDVYRRNYNELSRTQIERGNVVKEKFQELHNLIRAYIPEGERSERARLVNIGITDMEKACAMICKGIYSAETPQGDDAEPAAAEPASAEAVSRPRPETDGEETEEEI